MNESKYLSIYFFIYLFFVKFECLKDNIIDYVISLFVHLLYLYSLVVPDSTTENFWKWSRKKKNSTIFHFLNTHLLAKGFEYIDCIFFGEVRSPHQNGYPRYHKLYHIVRLQF